MEQVKVVKQNQEENSKDETNGKSGNGNGNSLLAPITSYEQTKIDSANKAYEEAKQSYTEKVRKYKTEKS